MMAYTPDPHLVFKDLASGVSAKLVFGEGETPVSATARGGIALRISPIGIVTAAGYDRNVLRDPAPSMRTSFDVADASHTERALPMMTASTVLTDAAARLAPAQAAGAETVSPVFQSPPMSALSTTGATPADAMSASADQGLQAALFVTAAQQAVFEAAPAVGADVRQPLEWGLRAGIDVTTGLTPADVIVLARSTPHDQAVVLVVWRDSATQPGMQPRPGRSWIDPGINPPTPVCYTPSAHLVFKAADAANSHLVFSCDNALSPGEPLRVIPVRRAYIVANDVVLRRSDDSVALACTSLSIGGDADAWTWSFDAQIGAENLDAVMPDSSGDPVELLAMINGASFLLLAEKISRDRSFGKAALRVSGRGISASLADPMFAKASFGNASDMTMAQIAESALTVNGVGIGWTIDWDAADWLVPTGVWAAHVTPIEAIAALAESAGAIVQSARASKTLKVLPRYPIKPWLWGAASPAIQIPESVFLTEAVEWVHKADYNGVYISGQGDGGVFGLSKRAGTAADVLAPMVTDPLCTSVDAIRARALPILCDTGAQALVTGSMPVLQESGIIDVNTLVQIGAGASARRGIVRAVRVAASHAKLRQTLEIECHG